MCIYISYHRVAEDQLDAAGYVSSVPGAESIGAFYTEETIAMTAYFAGFQSESCGGIYRYEWAIGDDDLGTGRESILPFTDSGVVVEGTSGSGYAQVWEVFCIIMTEDVCFSQCDRGVVK